MPHCTHRESIPLFHCELFSPITSITCWVTADPTWKCSQKSLAGSGRNSLRARTDLGKQLILLKTPPIPPSAGYLGTSISIQSFWVED